MSKLENHANTLESNFSDENEINIREIIFKYLYHWPLFILGVVICLTGSYLYLRYTQPIYMVSSTLLIKEKSQSATADILNKLEQGGGSSKSLYNEIEVLKSRTLMGKVVNRLHLNVQYINEGRMINTNGYENRPVDFISIDFNPGYYNKEFLLTFPTNESYLLEEGLTGKKVTGPLNNLHRTIFGTYRIKILDSTRNRVREKLKISISNPEDAIGAYLGNLNVVNTNNQSTILQLSYTTPVIKQGEDILNTLVQVYNEASLLDKNLAVERTLAFINKKIKPITGELTLVEQDVENFKSSQGIIDITTQADLYLKDVKLNENNVAELGIKLAVIDDILKYVHSNRSNEKLPTTMGIDDPVLLSQINELSILQLQKEQLLATTPVANPVFDPLNRQIGVLKANIETSLKNISNILEINKKQFQKVNAVTQGSIKKMPGQERQFISIKRQQETKEALYLYLLQKKEETELSYASAVADSRLIDPAISSGAPIKPNRQLIFIFAFLIGLVLPGVYVYGKDLLNNKVNSRSDLSNLTQAPILGELAFEEGSESIVVTTNSRTAIAEQFRSLRTNLQFIQGKKKGNNGSVTLFTSSVSGEGKSFVASNLATTLAISGKKTVILELDLRKPKIVKYLNLSTKAGLSNYLIGKATYEEILLTTGLNKNLYVMGSGPIPPNPSELLMNSEIEELINRLKLEFDEIIIDAPPVGLVTDAQILSRLADSTIYIVRYGVTLKSHLMQFDKLYRENKFPKINIVFNGLDIEGKHGYGYGYGYGYYSDSDKKRELSFKSMMKNVLKRF